MFTYRNISSSVKTFYGVEFKPGDIHEVPGYINSLYMVRCNKPEPVSVKVDKTMKTKPSKTKTDDESPKSVHDEQDNLTNVVKSEE